MQISIQHCVFPSFGHLLALTLAPLHQGVPNVRVYVISAIGNQIMDHEFHCALPLVASPGAGVKVS